MLSCPGIATGNRAGVSVPTPALADRMTGCVRWRGYLCRPADGSAICHRRRRRARVGAFYLWFLLALLSPIGFPLYSMLSTVDIYFIHFVSLSRKENTRLRGTSTYTYVHTYFTYIYIYIIFPPVYFFHVTHSKKQCWHSPNINLGKKICRPERVLVHGLPRVTYGHSSPPSDGFAVEGRL